MIFEGTKKLIFFGLGLTRAGLSMPNVVLLIPIADILDVTVTELLRGEKIDTQKNIEKKEIDKNEVNYDFNYCNLYEFIC